MIFGEIFSGPNSVLKSTWLYILASLIVALLVYPLPCLPHSLFISVLVYAPPCFTPLLVYPPPCLPPFLFSLFVIPRLNGSRKGEQQYGIFCSPVFEGRLYYGRPRLKRFSRSSGSILRSRERHANMESLWKKGGIAWFGKCLMVLSRLIPPRKWAWESFAVVWLLAG